MLAPPAAPSATSSQAPAPRSRPVRTSKDPLIRSLFGDEELAQIAEHRIRVGGSTERDAVELAVAWTGNVRKIDADRGLPSSDRSVWSEHDLVGTLFLRDHLPASGPIAEDLARYPSARSVSR
ncbi:hypothetical protein P3T37_006542 [Kitasatospora sp. MAA4]|uniref:hypothetical protein n=1 Tax=Kitasatospora sp. MAA4 TaxID=3035093 RepID=UPI0024739F3A|nr:hypothetical protein [Kitasatospora sp. MAA4]MDH6137110.1 hypothetical protein [Kitasatospora sp. MAA4]